MKRGQRTFVHATTPVAWDASAAQLTDVAEPDYAVDFSGNSAQTEQVDYSLSITYTNDMPAIVTDAIAYNRKNVTYDKSLILQVAYLSGVTGLLQAAYKSGKIDKEFTWMVFSAQQFLSRSPSVNLKIDGKLGPATRTAMNKWYANASAFNQANVNPTGHAWVVRELVRLVNGSYIRSAMPGKTVKDKEFSLLVLAAQRIFFPGQPADHDGKFGEKTKAKFFKWLADEKAAKNLENLTSIAEQLDLSKYSEPDRWPKITPVVNSFEPAIKPIVPEKRWFYKHLKVDWAGDPFLVEVKGKDVLFNAKPVAKELEIVVSYTGFNQYNRRENIQSIRLSGGKYNPIVYALPSNSDTKGGITANYVFIDLYGDGTHTIMLKDISTETKGWVPAKREHDMSTGKIGEGALIMNTIIITQNGAVPEGSVFLTTIPVTGITSLSEYDAILEAANELGKITDVPWKYGITLNGEWSKLRDSLPEYARKAASTKANNRTVASHAAALREMLANVRPKLLATSMFQYKESHPASIATEASVDVSNVRSLYCKAVFKSMTNIKEANNYLALADKSYSLLPYLLTNLYLRESAGIEEQINEVRILGGQIMNYRDRTGQPVIYKGIEKVLGIRRDLNNSDTTDFLMGWVKALRRENNQGSLSVFQKTMAVSALARQASGLFSMMAIYEMFRSFDGQMDAMATFVDAVTLSDGKRLAAKYVSDFDKILLPLNKTYQKYGNTIPSTKAGIKDWENAESAAFEGFTKIAARKSFQTDIDKITGLLENVALVKGIVKAIIIVALAALASAVGSPIAGAAILEAGITGTALSLSVFATEVFIFTLTERALSSATGNIPETSLLQDLIVNAATFGILKPMSIVNKTAFRLFADPAKVPKLFMASEMLSGMASLQMLAETQYYLTNGEMMSWKERGITLAQNMTLVGFMRLGGYVAKPFQDRMDVKVQEVLNKNFAGDLKALEVSRAELSRQLGLLQKETTITPEQITALGKAIESQFNTEIAVLEASKQKGLSEELANAEIVKYKQRINEMEILLAHAGFEVKLGMLDNFNVVGKGEVVYSDPAIIPELERYYKELPEGKFEQESEGVYIGSAGNEKVRYIKEKISIESDGLPILTIETTGNNRTYYIDGDEVGSASLSTDNYLNFDINIPDFWQKQGHASQIFKDAISFYEDQGQIINGIIGRWVRNSSYKEGMSVNLKVFITDFITKDLSFEQSALNTPTGKIALKNGYSKVVLSDWEILDLNTAKPAEIYWMEVKFKKP